MASHRSLLGLTSAVYKRSLPLTQRAIVQLKPAHPFSNKALQFALPSCRLLSFTTANMAPLPPSMRVVQINKNGGVEVLEHNNIPVPTPAADEILVRNHYVGINFIDTYFRTGLYPTPSFPLTLGREAAGEVISVGSSVPAELAKPGAKVVYMHTSTYSEYTAVPAEKVVPVPEGVSLEDAAAVFLQGLTAWTFICEAAQVKAGQWTLVHAAAGGVGILLCQMLRSVGAKVIGTASTKEKLELARKNGAEWTINSSDDVVSKVREITGGHGIDVIFDGVGKVTFEPDMEMVALKGQIISFGNASGPVDPLNILRLGPKNIRVMRPQVYGYISQRDELEKYSRELFDMVKSGKLNVFIHKVYPLADAAHAHNDIEGRKTTGKLLLKP